MEEPAFQGADGQFNRALFDQLLRNAGLTEAGFVGEQRAAMARLHLAEAIAGDAARFRWRPARRCTATATSAARPPTSSSPPDAGGRDPGPDGRAAAEPSSTSARRLPGARIPRARRPRARCRRRWRSRRSVTRRGCAPALRAGEGEVRHPRAPHDPADHPSRRRRRPRPPSTGSRKAPPSRRSRRSGTSRRRTWSSGPSPRPRCSTRRSPKPPSRSQEGAVSGPVAGPVRPGARPRDARSSRRPCGPSRRSRPRSARELAQARARAEIETVHDAIEDMRAGARPLADIAKEKGLTLVQVPAVDAQRPRQGRATRSRLPEREALLQAAFASDIGVDNEALRIGERRLCLVRRDRHRARPREDPRRGPRRGRAPMARGRGRASGCPRRRASSPSASTRARPSRPSAPEIGAPVKTATDLARSAAKDDLTAEAVNRIFAMPVGKAGNAPTAPDAARCSRSRRRPCRRFVTTTQEAQSAEDQLRDGMGDDLISQYIAQVRQDLGVTINQQALRQATGGERLSHERSRRISTPSRRPTTAGEAGVAAHHPRRRSADARRGLPEAAARPQGRRPSCSNPSKAAPSAAASR